MLDENLGFPEALAMPLHELYYGGCLPGAAVGLYYPGKWNDIHGSMGWTKHQLGKPPTATSSSTGKLLYVQCAGTRPLQPLSVSVSLASPLSLPLTCKRKNGSSPNPSAEVFWHQAAAAKEPPKSSSGRDKFWQKAGRGEGV